MSSGPTLKRGRPKKNGDAARLFLRDVKITKRMSAECQKLAQIPEADFLQMLADDKAAGKRTTEGGMIRRWYGEKARRIASLERMAAELRAAGWTVFPPSDDDDPAA
jgi:hypothetical protein